MGLDFTGDFRVVFDFLTGAGAESSSSELESTDALAFARAFEESFEGYEARMISDLRSTYEDLCIQIPLHRPSSPFSL